MMSFFQIGAENAKLQKLLEAFDSIKAKVSLFYILKKQTYSLLFDYLKVPRTFSRRNYFSGFLQPVFVCVPITVQRLVKIRQMSALIYIFWMWLYKNAICHGVHVAILTKISEQRRTGLQLEVFRNGGWKKMLQELDQSQMFIPKPLKFLHFLNVGVPGEGSCDWPVPQFLLFSSLLSGQADHLR